MVKSLKSQPLDLVMPSAWAMFDRVTGPLDLVTQDANEAKRWTNDDGHFPRRRKLKRIGTLVTGNVTEYSRTVLDVVSFIEGRVPCEEHHGNEWMTTHHHCR